MKECSTCKRCFGDHNEICDIDQTLLKPTLAGLPIIANRYRIDERLGYGALGITYRSFDIEKQQNVAVKVILAEYVQADPQCVPVLFKEVETAAAIDHPCVVKILDYGKSPADYLYIVMEYLKGSSLKKILKDSGPLDMALAIGYTCAICEAVDAAHRRGQLHRDLKPANVVVLDDGTGPADSIKVLDFGQSRIKSVEMLGVLPAGKGQTILGTPFYQSPEQCNSEEIDERSDVYSIGIMLYHMLTGQVPFKGPTYPAVLEQHISLPPRPPRTLRAEIPDTLEVAVLRAIEKDPDKRFQTVLALANSLRPALKRLASLPPPALKEEINTGSRSVIARTAAAVSAPTPKEDPDRMAKAYEARQTMQADIVERTSERRAEKREGKKSRSNEDNNNGKDPVIQSVVSELLRELEAPPSKPTKRLKAMRRTQPVEIISITSPPNEPVSTVPVPQQSSQPIVNISTEPSLDDSLAVFENKVSALDATSPLPPEVAAILPAVAPPPKIESLPPSKDTKKSIPPVRKKLPPPPPHEDKPEHYKKRERHATIDAPKIERSQIKSGNLEITAALETTTAFPAELARRFEAPKGESKSDNKAAQRSVVLSPAMIVYIYCDQFLPPKKLRQFKREMHNFFVVEREALAALMLTMAILSLRKRNSLKISPVSAIVPLLRRKLSLEDDDQQLVLQLVNGAVKPLDKLERRVLDSLGKVNAATLASVFQAFIDPANIRSVCVAEAINDIVAEEVAEQKLIERVVKEYKIPPDPGESDYAFRSNDDEIGRYFSQLDDVKEFMEKVKNEALINMGNKKIQIFEFINSYYKDLFLRQSQSLM